MKKLVAPSWKKIFAACSQLFITVLLCWLLLVPSTAQIAPPDFLCVRNDTLVWEVPVNNCGPFNAYVIYASRDWEGPYSVLATISDPSETTFFHEEAGNDQWFYYLQSDFDCPAETPQQSDTLDNRIPDTGPIERVTVSGDSVWIEWSPSPSPEVFAYIISRNTVAGTSIIDTVFGQTSYVDTGASPTARPETYFVVAVDRCGNISLVDVPHNTIFLTVTEVSPCEQTITLNWNPYLNWPKGVGKQEIWLSLNGAPHEKAGEVDGSATSFTLENVDDGEEYCFFVRAIQKDSDIFSNSSEVCQTLDIVQPVRELVVTNATYTENDQLEVNWIWNANAEITSFSILSSEDDLNYEQIETLSPSFPLSAENSFTHSPSNAVKGPLYFQVRTTDGCEDMALSNGVPTIFLEGQALEGGANSLNWSEYFNEFGSLTGYELFKVVGNTTLSVAGLDPLTTSYVDEIDLTQPDAAGACYFVVASAGLSLPDGSAKTVRSRSNTVCLEQTARLYVPNAFVPDGFNKVFRPVLQFGQPASYTMTIYDRYGGVIYETNSIEQGWNGKKDGRPLPQGVYVYLIRLEQAGGQPVVESGTVLLLR